MSLDNLAVLHERVKKIVIITELRKSHIKHITKLQINIIAVAYRAISKLEDLSSPKYCKLFL